jgi:membrane protease YdiL (CAAX protease family)
MDTLFARLKASPLLARAVPFLVFVGLTAMQGQLGEPSRYWFYFAKTITGAWLLWSLRDAIREMKWALSWEAVAAGVGVFVMWVGIDGFYLHSAELFQGYLNPLLRRMGLGFLAGADQPSVLWNPFAQFGDGSAMAWFFVVVRILGSSIVVPPLEEVFYRSFVYRWISKPDFETVPLGQFAWKPFLLTALLFGFGHNEWLAGILCAAAYQGLVCWKKRLGDAMTAHAITNLLLGLWVVWKGAWHFW